MPSIDDLRASRDLAVSFLRSIGDVDWSMPVRDLDFDIAGMCAHMSQTNFWYAIDLAAGGEDLVAVVPEIKKDSSPADLTASVDVGADVLAAVIAAAPDGVRGFHPFGQADPSGFAAMACDEMLIHSYDIAHGLDREFTVPLDLAGRVLAQLFPWADVHDDAWQSLLWANGRIELGGRPRLSKWRWHCAPLAEWDGTMP